MFEERARKYSGKRQLVQTRSGMSWKETEWREPTEGAASQCGREGPSERTRDREPNASTPLTHKHRGSLLGNHRRAGTLRGAQRVRPRDGAAQATGLPEASTSCKQEGTARPTHICFTWETGHEVP